MPVGGSTAIGAMGYVAAMSEIQDDEKRISLHFSTIMFASGPAGTQAGLVVGKAIANWPGQILGISVAKAGHQLQQDVFNLAQATAATRPGFRSTDSWSALTIRSWDRVSPEQQGM